MAEDPELLKKQLDLLWNKVREQADRPLPTHPEKADLASAFEAAQQEIQAEALNLLRSRFDKERTYWENLLTAKEDAIARLQAEVEESKRRNLELKGKITELQEAQSQLIQQSFGTLEMQRRSTELKLEQMQKEMDEARERALALELELREERATHESLRREWDEKEKEGFERRDLQEQELQKLQEELIKARSAALEKNSALEESVALLQKQVAENLSKFESDRQALQQQIQERAAQIEALTQEYAALKAQLEKEHEQKKLAAMERERRSAQEEQDRKKLVEQLLSRENRAKELQAQLDEAIEAKKAGEEALLKKQEEIDFQDQLLRKRREEWVASVQDQANQQLRISGRIVDLLNKIETGAPAAASAAAETPAGPPEAFPRLKPLIPTVSGAPERAEPPAATTPTRAVAYPNLRNRWVLGLDVALLKLRNFARAEKWIAISMAGVLLFLVTAGYFFYESEGRKSLQAQKLLSQGNEAYTQGQLAESVKMLEKAYSLDPENSIVRNSFALVLGEVANKDYLDGNYEEALKKTELLNRLMPEDPEVVRLHGSILQALGKSAPKN